MSQQFTAWQFITSEVPGLCYLSEKERRKNILYFVYQEETCNVELPPHSHWQGYIEFRTPLGGDEVCQMIGVPNCHVEHAYGSRKAHRESCTKEEHRAPGSNPEEWKVEISEAENLLEFYVELCEAGKKRIETMSAECNSLQKEIDVTRKVMANCKRDIIEQMAAGKKKSSKKNARVRVARQKFERRRHKLSTKN